ncbi:FAD-dependent oxidoreductase [Baekduia soli]|uniref:FAD-dependent oxidoreductase n=1 Tax=Baekduia soli TaxID=496014 RepID=A0A5B8U2X0_9ACTN|nr:FAD-dependent oxidoreductase [Baekduia soli]QEC47281.1 FAD-dependent oxidoreductase [Baekduia soli]
MSDAGAAVRTRVAIVGGGIAGCSLLYHLARLGCTDTLLIEQNELTSGSTWHAAGLCTQYNGNRSLMRLLKSSVEIYSGLEQATGQPVDFHASGSIRLATDSDRVDDLLHVKGIADHVGLPLEIIDADRVLELFPLVSPHGILAAAHLPTDGHVDPSSVTQAFAAAATDAGAQIRRHTTVISMSPRSGGGWHVETTRGAVEADRVVIAAGQWSRQVGLLAGVDLPIRPLQHQYVVTEAMPGLRERATELPVLRDPQESFYVRQEIDSLLIGPFERNALTWALDGIPEGFHGRLLPGNIDQLEEVLHGVARRIPGFDEIGLKRVINGPDGYTPDGRCLMGPIPGGRDLFALCGFSIFGIVFGGGAGRLAAEWLVDGRPSEDLWALDARRFGEYARSTAYVVEKARQVYTREYAIHYPHEELPAARGLKTTPIHDLLKANGAVFGERFGWERPLYFEPEPGGPEVDYSFRRPSWHDQVGRECHAVRSAVGVLDQSSFAKFEVSGPGAEPFLDRLCANRLPAEAGRIALTQACNERGGVECDITVTRLSGDRFYIVSAAATETHDLEWITTHAPAEGVRVENQTARRGVLTIAGPRSRELLSRITESDLSNDAFPFFSARELFIGMAPVRLMRLSYVGELGFELHHDIEYQRYLYQVVHDAGSDLGLIDFGYHALESMRLEMAFRLWGADMSPQFSPLESGMERFVDLDKDFIGRDALAASAAAGVARRMCALLVDADDADPHAFEPVFCDGEVIGSVDAGGYGHVMGTALALAYLPVEHTVPGTELEVEVLGVRCRAVVSEEPPIRRHHRAPAPISPGLTQHDLTSAMTDHAGLERT